MSKWNKSQKVKIAARAQRDAVIRRKLLAARIRNVETLHKVNDGQTVIISKLQKEVDRLHSIDAALKDFKLEQQIKQQDDLAREGFAEVLTSRQKPRRYK